ncbi:MAG TPA: hypothetical protein DCP02_06070 [Actinobacteria bacterium]|nr:hypothetical protein [Actinomycetota bacterium]
MKRSIWIIITVFALMAGLAIGVFGVPKMVQDRVFVPELKVIGDIRNVINISDLDIFEDGPMLNIEGDTIKASPLRQLIDSGEPFSQQNSVIIVGHDGSVAELDYDDLAKSYLAFNSEHGWHSINLNHPVSTKIKRIKEIAVISKVTDIDYEYGLSIITTGENLLNITPGQAYGRMTEYLNPEGNVSMEKDGSQHKAFIYSKKKVIRIEELLDYDIEENIVLMGRDGNIVYTGNIGSVELDDNHFNYNDGLSGDREIIDLAGIMMDPPGASIMNVYNDCIYYTGLDEKVMVIILDGFGNHQYEYAYANNYIDFMRDASSITTASSVIKPVTNSGLAAMFTGKPPAENGVHNHDNRQPLVPTIFASIIHDNKKALYVEGDIQILKTEIDPVLNIDRNNDGYTDDDIFECSMENIDSGFDLMVVHFHSIDDMGHDFGDTAAETMDRVKILDSYVEELVLAWDGYVIVTADHGMHPTPDGGSHGEFCYEDMFVPYIVFSPGQ